jgi:hypothetical protein
MQAGRMGDASAAEQLSLPVSSAKPQFAAGAGSSRQRRILCDQSHAILLARCNLQCKGSGTCMRLQPPSPGCSCNRVRLMRAARHALW